MPMPLQRRGESKQDYCTPAPFVQAVQLRLGIPAFMHDFAADIINSVGATYFDADLDALTVSHWEHFVQGGWGWCNPPFECIAPWAMKCAQTGAAGGHLALLTPASVGSNWFRDHIDGQALVLALNGRLSFTDSVYPKDCMLSLFGPTIRPGFAVWSWREQGRMLRERLHDAQDGPTA